jgi:MFS family permease
VVWTIGLSVLADTLPTEQLGVAMGTIGGIASFAMVSAPFLGGTIFHNFGFEAVFYVLSGMLWIDVILRLLMIERDDAKRWGIGLDSDLGDDEGETLLQTTPESPKSLASLLFVLSSSYSVN